MDMWDGWREKDQSRLYMDTFREREAEEEEDLDEQSQGRPEGEKYLLDKLTWIGEATRNREAYYRSSLARASSSVH